MRCGAVAQLVAALLPLGIPLKAFDASTDAANAGALRRAAHMKIE